MRLNIALIGAGMFGGEVHLRAYAEFQRCGLGPHLGRIGLGTWARDLGPIEFRLAAVATRTEGSARRASAQFEALTGTEPYLVWGEAPWREISKRDIDVVAVATPDHLHSPVVLDALRGGAHVICEKPLCLELPEADQIIETAREAKRIVALDMHKRYDPDHLKIRDELLRQIGEPLYGTAYLEEPLEVSSQTFKWAERSDPFSYVGSHWVDLIYHYFHSKPVSLTALGQKKKLVQQGIDAYDAVQVRVDYENGMSIAFHNNWITPPDFEGPVNQGHELVGTEGKVESDQQFRGLRWWRAGAGSRTANTHFTRAVVASPGGAEPPGYTGYGVDSLAAGLAAICQAKCFGTTVEELRGHYPNLEEARITVAILHAARLVRDLNYKYVGAGKGAVVTARFGADGITIIDPQRLAENPAAVFDRIYQKPV